MEPDQAYYWTDEWQANEAAAVEEIRNGEALTFDNADDAIEWLDAHLEDPNRPGYCATCGCAWECPAYGPAWVRSQSSPSTSSTSPTMRPPSTR